MTPTTPSDGNPDLRDDVHSHGPHLHGYVSPLVDRGDTPAELAEAPEERPAEETHTGRIEALGHLSAALALIDCALEAIDEQTLEPDVPDEAYWSYKTGAARVALQEAADKLAEPFEIANVLQTIEEIVEQNGLSIAGTHVTRNGRAAIVRAIVDARAHAKEDETLAWRCDNCEDVFAGADPPANCPSCDVGPHGSWTGADPADVGRGPREPTDDEIYNRPGMEGGMPYPIDHDAHQRYEEDTRNG
jgi:hypothetical protein